MEDMKKVLGKKDKKEDPMKKEAKLSALKGLRNEMSDMMKGDLSGKMNKVTVAAPDKESLKKGLDKAKSVVDEVPDMEDETPDMEKAEEDSGEDLDNDMELGESPEHQDKVVGHMSVDEIDEMMQKLAEMKKKLNG